MNSVTSIDRERSNPAYLNAGGLVLHKDGIGINFQHHRTGDANTVMFVESRRVSAQDGNTAVRIGLASIPDDADELRRRHKNLVSDGLTSIVEQDSQGTGNRDFFIQELLAFDQCWHLHIERSVAGTEFKVCVPVYHRNGVNDTAVIAPLRIG